MDFSREHPANPRPDRRAFLGEAAAALGTAVLPWNAAPAQAPNSQPEESVDLPMVQVASKDPDLPGTWYILDRTKQIRKLVDRKSLLPVGPKSLVLIEMTQSVTLAAAKTAKFFLAAGMPGDIGDEQALLGMLPSFRTEKGKDIPFKVVFHQAKGHGVRVAQFKLEDCPTEVPIVQSLKYVLVNPPALTPEQKATITETLRKRSGKRKEREETPGLPGPVFTEGGPGYVGAAQGKSHFETIYNVLKATDETIAYDGAAKFNTADPDQAKSNKRGPCGPRCRVAEKALVGVARACSMVIYHQTLSTRHAALVIEDPETGHYFIGDVTIKNPTLCPHFGTCYFITPYRNEGIPNPYKANVDFNGPIFVHPASQGAAMTQIRPMSLDASSHGGYKDQAKCQAWLKKIPGEFRDMEKKLIG